MPSEKRSSLSLLISTNFKMLAPLQIQVNDQALAKSKKQGRQRTNAITNLDCVLGNMLATLALQPQNNLLGSLSLWSKRGRAEKYVNI
jgi:hypothetical protein